MCMICETIGLKRETADVHIVPLGDLQDHEETRDCWCTPRLESEGDTTIVVHHALDGRELIEQHGVN